MGQVIGKPVDLEWHSKMLTDAQHRQKIDTAATRVLRWREVLRCAIAPADDHLSDPSDVFMIFEQDQASFENHKGKPFKDSELSGKTADLILFDESCYDLHLTLPAAPRAEFEAMITNEINFASPFREEDAHAFWRANETARGDWDVHIGVVLKSEAARALKMARDKGLHPRRVVRLGPDEASSIYAAPAWLNGETSGADTARARFPRALLLPAAALGLFVLSTGVQMGLTGMEVNALRDRASAADQRLRVAAGEASFQRKVDLSLASARQNVEIIALLSAALPDDTWLDRITLTDDTIRMVGFGPSGAETVRLLSEIEGVSNPRSIGTVTRDNTQNVERFVIEFDLIRPAS